VLVSDDAADAAMMLDVDEARTLAAKLLLAMCLAGAERAREAGDAVASLALAITAAQFLQLQKLLERNDQ